MFLSVFITLTFTISLLLTTVIIFISLSTARVFRLQQSEAYAFQHSQTLNTRQLSHYLYNISLVPPSIRATQEIQKTQPYPPPAWVRARTTQVKAVTDDIIVEKDISQIKAG